MSVSFTAEQVAEHNTRDDLYIIYNDKVYNCSEYLDEHPGGEEVILDCAGTDATEPFDDIGHSEDAREMLDSMLVGELKGGSKKSNNGSKSGNSSSTNGSNSSVLIAAGAAIAIAIVAFAVTRK
ncbi:hypothetical protein CANARDRAFT_29593 [[Candida] arabinofermentans NRRL YB-2248]|uniref:Cytochrome b5 heme-binding domain-containing protein n=1 Tax=[Candida] arabinofermentans NRRL YB-2248 TaxID=983967 RepID=A0A1E4SWP0_9ASCO|nr:hypothetical protein CANARDRAFT_29593 [[Candida] arabinofermentans NRRL YB-2248]